MSQLLSLDQPVSPTASNDSHYGRLFIAVLFIDIVDSTRLVAAFGDRHWRDLLVDFHAIVRSVINDFEGREVDAVGDGFLVAFDDVTCAVYCAAAIRAGIRPLGLEIRAGIHAGECETHDGKPVGLVVHVGARLRVLAAPGEILVSATVRELALDSDLEFTDRGERDLRGLDTPWRLFAAKF
jgi:class 3 adenylate cyclase